MQYQKLQSSALQEKACSYIDNRHDLFCLEFSSLLHSFWYNVHTSVTYSAVMYTAGIGTTIKHTAVTFTAYKYITDTNIPVLKIAILSHTIQTLQPNTLQLCTLQIFTLKSLCCSYLVTYGAINIMHIPIRKTEV